MWPDSFSIENHVKTLRLTEHWTKDSEKNPFIQNVNKHNFEKLSTAAELQFFFTIFNPDWEYFQNITCKDRHFYIAL